MENKETTDCIICEKSKLSKIKTVLIHSTTLTLVKCKICNLIFFSPRLKEDMIKGIYQKDLLKQSKYNLSYIKEDIQNFSKRLNIIKKYLKNKQSVLDVGCSVGTFLYCCKKFNFKEICGVDLNEKTNKICRDKYGYTVSTKTPNKKFDLINLSDVIEHLHNPKEFLLKIRNNLNGGGVIAITTPNINNPINKIINIKPEEHQYYFNKKTLSKLLRICGYNVIYVNKWNRYHSLKNLVNTSTAKRIKSVLKLFIKLRLDSLFNFIVLKNLYTDFFVIAEINQSIKNLK